MASSRRLRARTFGVISLLACLCAWLFSAPVFPVLAAAPHSTTVRGHLCGHDFVCEDALINSYSLILKQSRHTYIRVVFNFLATGRKLPGSDFYYRNTAVNTGSKSSNNPRVQVFIRSAPDKKVSEKLVGIYDMHVHFYDRQKNKSEHTDTTSGVVQLKFEGGDFLSGSFCARESPRVIWDDERIAD